MSDDELVCGESYDHDLPPEEWIDGMCVQVCRTCGAELITDEDER